jgi:hypothetical protein
LDEVAIEVVPDADWPPYLLGPRENILALGVIALKFCQLENVLSVIFSEAVALPLERSDLIFQKLTNDVRDKVIRQSLQAATPKVLTDHVHHFLRGFTICAMNRHDIMHSHSGGVHRRSPTDAIVLSKNTRSGGRVFTAPGTDELREIADAINEYSHYGATVGIHLNVCLALLAAGKDWPPTSLEKPPKPRSLRWRSLPEYRTGILPPPPYLE